MSFLDKSIVKVDLAIIQARELSRVHLWQYFLSEPQIPVDTGFMRNQAIGSLLSSGLGGLAPDYILDMWFNTFYAPFVQDKQRFLEKIKPTIFRIVRNDWIEALANQGLRAEVTIVG